MKRTTPDEIQRRVRASLIEDRGFIDRWHGPDNDPVDKYLVDPPRLMRFRLPDGVGYIRLWAVYDERPGEATDGYLVVYDPRADEFGLATKPDGIRLGCLVGYYGLTLGEAVDSM